MKIDQVTRNFLTGPTKVAPGNRLGVGEFQIEDPTYLTFRLGFLFTPVETINGLTAGLLLPRANPLSACNYLDRINETNRADILEKFISDLQTISNDYPWYFQSLSGLQKFTQINLKNSIQTNVDDSLEISCLESIDLRMTKMFDMYKKATYDVVNRRDMLPDTLRQFNFQIHITEFRKFHTFTMNSTANNLPNPQSPLMQAYGGLQDISNVVGVASSLKSGLSNNATNNVSLIEQQLQNFAPLSSAVAAIAELDNFVSVLTFNCYRCNFLLDDFQPYLNDISAGLPDMAAQKFKISALKVYQTNTYPISKMVLRDAIAQSQYQTTTAATTKDFTDGSTQSIPATTNSIGAPVTDISDGVFPLSMDYVTVGQLQTVANNTLVNDNLYGNVNTTGGNLISTLEQKFQNQSFNPLNLLESVATNTIENAFSNLILGNIYNINGENDLSGVAAMAPSTISPVDLEGAPENFTPSSNMDYSGTENYAISKISLTGQTPSENISEVTLTSNTDQFSDSPITISGFSEDFKPTNIGVSGFVENFVPGPIDLTGIIPDESITEIDLTGNTDPFSVTPNPLTGDVDPFSVTPNPLEGTADNSTVTTVALEGNSDKPSISEITLESSTSNLQITDIELTSNADNPQITTIQLTAAKIQSDLLSQNVFGRYQSVQTKIVPISLDPASTDSKISAIELDPAKSSLTVQQAPLSGTGMNTKITPLELSSTPEQFQISKNVFPDASKPSVTPIVPVSAESESYTPPPLAADPTTGVNYSNLKITPPNILENE